MSITVIYNAIVPLLSGQVEYTPEGGVPEVFDCNQCHWWVCCLWNTVNPTACQKCGCQGILTYRNK